MKKIIPSVLLITGFLLGASALSALAAYTQAPSNPPTCPDTTSGCNPPINEGSTAQTKKGSLVLNFDNADSIGLTILGKLKIIDSGAVAGTDAGKVLTADANGVGTWQAVASGSGFTFGSYTAETIPDADALTTLTVSGSNNAGVSSSAKAILAFIKSDTNCTDQSNAWQIYDMSGRQVAEVGGNTGAGETVSAQDVQLIIPLTTGQFKYITGGNCSGTLNVIAEIM